MSQWNRISSVLAAGPDRSSLDPGSRCALRERLLRRQWHASHLTDGFGPQAVSKLRIHEFIKDNLPLTLLHVILGGAFCAGPAIGERCYSTPIAQPGLYTASAEVALDALDRLLIRWREQNAAYMAVQRGASLPALTTRLCRKVSIGAVDRTVVDDRPGKRKCGTGR